MEHSRWVVKGLKRISRRRRFGHLLARRFPRRLGLLQHAVLQRRARNGVLGLLLGPVFCVDGEGANRSRGEVKVDRATEQGGNGTRLAEFVLRRAPFGDVLLPEVAEEASRAVG
jgi:hypothetical protein